MSRSHRVEVYRKNTVTIKHHREFTIFALDFELVFFIFVVFIDKFCTDHKSFKRLVR